MTAAQPRLPRARGWAARWLLVAVAVAAGLPVRPLAAATFTVTDLGDSGQPGQLRTIINTQANNGDTIAIPAGTITLAGPLDEDANAGGDLDIAKSLTIQGAGAGSTTIDGAGRDRVFDVLPGVTLTVRDLTVQNGNRPAGSGGGLRNAGTLTLERVTVRNNFANAGGGLENTGTLTLTAATVSANGAAIGGGGGLLNPGTATLTNVTVSSNGAQGRGGGILNSGTLTLTNVTLTGNGGGTSFSPALTLFNTGTVQLRNTIIDGPFTIGGSCGNDGTILSLGHSLGSDGTCGLTGPGDLPSTIPKLAPLQDHGGPTLVHALYPSSPAIDAGDPTGCPATDQRGVARPADGNLDGTAICDIGAYEAVAVATPEIVTGAGPGGGPHVRGFTGGGVLVASFFAYAPSFTGGVFVAAGQLDGVGPPEIVTGAGPGGGPHVRAFDADGTPRGTSFFAFLPAFTGGVRVAVCDFDGDGRGEIAVGAGPGGGPHVRVLRLDPAGQPTQELAGFFAYAPQFSGGVFVACGDVDGDGRPDLVTGADAGGGPHVRAFRLDATAPGGVVPILDFFAYDPSFLVGVRVATGNIDGSDRASIIVGPGPGIGSIIRAFKWTGSALQLLISPFVYNVSFTGGVFVGSGRISGDTRAAIFTGPGGGGGPHVRVLILNIGVNDFFAYDATFTGGVTVAGP